MARPAGSKNVKHRAALMTMLHERFGEEFDPLRRMAEQANALADAADASGERQDRDSAVNALEKVVKYVYPQLKAVEMDLSNEDGSLKVPNRIELVPVYDDKAETEGDQAE